jgi:hypothetical protein
MTKLKLWRDFLMEKTKAEKGKHNGYGAKALMAVPERS